MPTVKDLLQASISEDALGFTDMYNEIMDERIGLAVEAKRLAVAQSIYGDEVVSEEVDTDEEVVSEDNEDLEDIDLDLEDLDISEEDLEEEDIAEDGEEADDQDA